MGYHRSGFDVVGVDVRPQPRYPFEFVQDNALEYLRDHLAYAVNRFDAVHASPPCQAYSTLRARTGGDYPDLVAATRELFEQTGLPWVIENVVGAPLRDPFMLCGSAFGLDVGGRQLRRHRLFETNFPVLVPSCHHRGQPIGVYGTGGGGQMTRGYKAAGVEEAQAVLGTPWMTLAECAQAVPPAYTELVGHQLMQHVRAAVPR